MSPIKPGGPAEPARETCNDYVPYYILDKCGSCVTGLLWDLVGHVNQKVPAVLCPLLCHLIQGCHENLEDPTVQCNLERQTVFPIGGPTGKETDVQGVRQVNLQTGDGVYLHFQCLLSLQEYQGFGVHMAVCHLQVKEGGSKEVGEVTQYWKEELVSKSRRFMKLKLMSDCLKLYL